MFYKLIFSSMLLLSVCFAANDIKNLDTFKASFTQKIVSTSDNIIEYKGNVFIKKSGKILWQYETPIKKNVYIDNTMAIVDEPELEQAIFTKLDNEINIIKLLNEAKKIETAKMGKRNKANQKNREKSITGFYEKNGFKKIGDNRLLYTFTNL